MDKKQLKYTYTTLGIYDQSCTLVQVKKKHGICFTLNVC